MTKDIENPNPVPAALRARLVRLAYRYLGTVTDAEDIVQEACLRLLRNPDVRNTEAWLARVVTNVSLDRLRQIGARRETYIGPWLPEPVFDEEENPSDRELDVSFAVMRTLEALSPLERAAFFLHDLFDMDFEAVGETLERTPAAARKLASRARQAIKSSRPRFSATPADVERLLSAIGEAVITGDLSGLTALLTTDVELISDGGGKVLAALNVLKGSLAAARFLTGLVKKNIDVAWQLGRARVNGGAGLVISNTDGIDSVLTIDLDLDGRVAAIYIIRNPDKLVHVAAGFQKISMPGGVEEGYAQLSLARPL